MMSFKQQNSGGGGGGDLIKMFKKEKSMKKGDPDGLKKAPIQSSHLGPSKIQQRKPSPSKVTNELSNYMKPASRFDASKNKLQVSTTSLTSSSKINSMNNSEKQISSRPVSSSDHPGSRAVAKEMVRNSGLKPVRPSMKKNSGVGLHPTVNLSRDTCSSTAKIARNPEGLDVDEPDRASNQMLCSYKYCSLHGQKKHEASLPALKCFLSAKRQSVKVTNSVKQKEQSSARKNGRKNIYSKQQEGTLQLQSCEERTRDEVEIVDIVQGINWDHDETNQLQESYSVTSFEDYVDNNSEISIEPMEDFGKRIQYIEDERKEEAQLESEEGKAGYVDWEEAAGPYLYSQRNSLQRLDDFLGQTQGSILESRVEGCKFTPMQENNLSTSNNAGADSKISPEADSKILPEADNVKVDHEIQQNTTFSYANEEESEESANGNLQSGVELPNSPKELSASFISENPLAELTNSPKARYSSTIKITAENQESVRVFNPRPPRILPLKPEQEVEVVNLKHQTVEERKAAEEWMIDYALRKTLRRMAPARKRKVALLVAAFETVIQQEQCATVL